MSDESGGWVSFLILVGIFVWAFSGSWSDQIWYGVEYGVPLGAVQVGAKPSDCDFMRAPLGDKGCRYQAAVAAYNAAGEIVGGDGAPKYSHDTKTGKPIISYDNGHTWQWALIQDVKIHSVVVSWFKVTR